MNEEEKFVNRRGRQVLTQEVLGTIKLDQEPEEQITRKHVQQAARVRKKRSVRLARWQKLALVILILLVVGFPLAIGEYLRVDYDSSAHEAKQRVRTLGEMTLSKSSSENAPSTAVLSSVTKQVEQIRDDMCKGEFFDNLADLYPRAKESLERCFVTRESISALARELSSLYQQKVYTEDLVQILTPLGLDDQGQYANFVAQQEKWKTATEQLKELNPPTTLRESHASVQASAVEIQDVWIQLINANNSEDAAAFSSSEKELAELYEQFRSHQIIFLERIVQTQEAVIAAYATISR